VGWDGETRALGGRAFGLDATKILNLLRTTGLLRLVARSAGVARRDSNPGNPLLLTTRARTEYSGHGDVLLLRRVLLCLLLSIKKGNGIAYAGVSVVTPPTAPASLRILTIA
jgi:hypothetical protein